MHALSSNNTRTLAKTRHISYTQRTRFGSGVVNLHLGRRLEPYFDGCHGISCARKTEKWASLA